MKNTDLYAKAGNSWEDMQEDSNYMNNLYNNSDELKIVGITKAKYENDTSGFVGYTNELVNYLSQYNNNQEIVKEQLANSNTDVFTGEQFDDMSENAYENNLSILGSCNTNNPDTINLYVKMVILKKN